MFYMCSAQSCVYTACMFRNWSITRSLFPSVLICIAEFHRDLPVFSFAKTNITQHTTTQLTQHTTHSTPHTAHSTAYGQQSM